MKKRYRHLMLNQLDETLSQLQPLLSISRPSKGWIQTIRKTLGMTARQLAKRLGVSSPRITRLETDEVAGKVTLNMLRRTAETLDCVLVYGFVPKTSLTNTVKQQAFKVAQERVEYVAHSMQLEEQALSDKLLKQEIDKEIEELLEELPRTLWNMNYEQSGWNHTIN
ncbi:mobile mystery protein A [Candidatus Parabeggiatoa sp. HSG14]|uniref:mobile mystery protein A n=1 Tax=Candidatus Parabeggiatoa sp. HSG14 TaxID=3055593 RepID=UPI0025A841B6|nr:mobile mystery protein A [Thiotrichales bacterium HSG14]